MVAIELKATAFEPEHLGKLSFHLEALDRDERKPHENSAIGVGGSAPAPVARWAIAGC
jgi:YhcG PDDEXK nuclease domain